MSTLKIINLFSGPSGGKSTIAAGLFYKMKLQGYKVELVTEYPKDLAYDGTLDIMMDRQEVIFSEQNQRMHRLRGKVDFAITDSPILLSCVYPRINQALHNMRPWEALDEFETFVYKVHGTYINHNFLLRRPNQYQTYGRGQSLTEAQEIDKAITTMLTINNFSYAKMVADEHTVDNILDMIQHD